MTILIVEDDSGKERQISDAVNEVLPQAEVRIGRSYQSGLALALSWVPRLILLDMSIPSFDSNPFEGETGGPPLPYGGRDLMREVARKKLQTQLVVVTQYPVFGEGEDIMTLDQLKDELSRDFPRNYLSTIYYQSAQSEWKSQLRQVLLAVSGQ